MLPSGYVSVLASSDHIDLQLQSLNGEVSVLKIPRSTLGREVHKMALETLPSKPGARLTLHHGTSKLKLSQTLKEQGFLGNTAALSFAFGKTDLYRAWLRIQGSEHSEEEFALDGLTSLEHAIGGNSGLLAEAAIFLGQTATLGVFGILAARLCIAQHDVALKEQGIRGLGSFLNKSSNLTILWSGRYFSRLWCLFELASYLRHETIRERRNVQILPVHMCLLLLISCIQSTLWIVMIMILRGMDMRLKNIPILHNLLGRGGAAFIPVSLYVPWTTPRGT
eukprot:Skav200176  [mRNA]  locus=scaffold1159:286702:294008:- [translate_table: standard]